MLDFGYYNIDCMEGMREFPDNYFELAIVDPPYGIEKGLSASSRISKYGRMDIVNDARPNQEYFNELFRVSKNQIVWGFNHLSDLLPTTKEFIFWYKHNPVDSYSDGELAWTSFTKTAKCFDYPYWGGYNADKYRIHPTQKPVALYKWILDNYAKPGDKILDTHVGSASSLIACEDFGFQYVGFEIDKEYYDKGVKRLEQNRAQITINDLLGDWRFP